MKNGENGIAKGERRQSVLLRLVTFLEDELFAREPTIVTRTKGKKK